MQRKTIGIAGYMGSGKTTFSTILGNARGFRIINADAEAKKIMIGNKRIIDELVYSFGVDIIENGQLSSRRLGTIVFNSMEKLQKLNRIVHPILLDLLQNMIFNRKNETVIVDAALIPLWNIEKWFDVLIWVDASSAKRFERIMSKGISISSEELRHRIQMQEDLFAVPFSKSWQHIDNEGEIAMLYNAAALYAHI